jgi:hypothetical protein
MTIGAMRISEIPINPLTKLDLSKYCTPFLWIWILAFFVGDQLSSETSFTNACLGSVDPDKSSNTPINKKKEIVFIIKYL